MIVQAHEACGPMEIDSALTAIQTLRSELQDAKMAAVNTQLKPLPGESVCFSSFQDYFPDNLNTINSASIRSVKALIKYTLGRHYCFFLSWRSVLRIWAAPRSQWGPPWHSCSPVLPREMNITQVGDAAPLFHHLQCQ